MRGEYRIQWAVQPLRIPQREGRDVPTTVIRQLLEDLRGGGFNTSLVINGVVIEGQKVVAFENGVVFTVNAAGLARATRIEQIQSVNF